MIPADPDLEARGWTRRHLADAPRAREASALYASLGFEVHLEPLTPERLGPHCDACSAAVCAAWVLIYTRRPEAPDGPGRQRQGVSMEQVHGFEMTGPGTLQRTERPVPTPGDDEVCVEVAGCGVCHTDVGFLFGGVRTRREPPLILGHEISGRVVAAGEQHRSLVGEAVVIPAVLPCGTCPDCGAGRPMICPYQVMPGNDRDGGFATHVVMPGRGLCVVPDAPPDPDAPLREGSALTLRHLAVVSDAVSTPWQAVARAGVSRGDVAVVIGLGGVGGYAAQIAALMGAQVVGLDVDPRRLEAVRVPDALLVDPRDVEPRALRRRIVDWARERGALPTGWTVLECSGTAAGQRLAMDLLVPGATLMIVGFTLEKIEVRLSKLMALDARVLGTWGCDPALYPDIVRAVLHGRIDVLSGTELRPLDAATETLEDVHAHRLTKRVVLVPG